MDQAVLDTVGPAVALSRDIEGIDRWFFIRYQDPRGLHIRLRFRGTCRAVTILQEQLEPVLYERLSALRLINPPPPKRLLPIVAPETPSEYVGYDYALYEPEYAKYGGSRGVDIAEQLFMASSDLTLNTLKVTAGKPFDRAVLSVTLMLLAVELLLPSDQWSEFFSYYSHYWAGYTSASHSSLIKQLSQAAHRRLHLLARHVNELTSIAPLNDEIDRYCQALKRVRSALLSTGLSSSTSRLCFHYIHMMNNRLGILPLEEAYVSLLSAELARWRQHQE
mgnify:CR=1 FL=1